MPMIRVITLCGLAGLFIGLVGFSVKNLARGTGMLLHITAGTIGVLGLIGIWLYVQRLDQSK